MPAGARVRPHTGSPCPGGSDRRRHAPSRSGCPPAAHHPVSLRTLRVPNPGTPVEPEVVDPVLDENAVARHRPGLADRRAATRCRAMRHDGRRACLRPGTGEGMLTLGYKASAEQFGPRELVEIAVAAEAHGFESVAVSDHFQPWRHEGGHAPFSLAWMAAVGERTSRIRIGTSVMTPTFRYNPAVIAQAFASLGVLYPGRVFAGV